MSGTYICTYGCSEEVGYDVIVLIIIPDILEHMQIYTYSPIAIEYAHVIHPQKLYRVSCTMTVNIS